MDAGAPSYFSKQVAEAKRFYFPKGPGRRFEVESGGMEECPGSYDVERENFPHCVIEFIARGSARIRLGREDWKLLPGYLYVYDRGLSHRISSRTPQGMTKYFLILRGQDVRRILTGHGLAPGRVVQVHNAEIIAGIFQDIVTMGCGSPRGTREDCAAAARYLIFKIKQLTVTSERLMSGAYSAYLNALRVMERDCVRLTSIAEVAEACRLDPAYLCRLFQRFGKERPYACLLRLRMTYATDQLQERGRSVIAVAEELGFSDAAAFSRAFKRVNGVAPGHWRSPDHRP